MRKGFALKEAKNKKARKEEAKETRNIEKEKQDMFERH